MSAVPQPVSQETGLVARMGDRFGVEPNKLFVTLKATAFKSERAVSNEQMMALLIVAEQYHLNPFTREIFAYPDKGGGIVPVISIDGWVRIVNEHKMFDGLRFIFDEGAGAMTCVIYRKDREHPIEVTEYIAECRRNTDAWNKMPRRMIRHRALVQCARIAFGFAGVYDEDEAEAVRDSRMPRTVSTPAPSTPSNAERFQAMARGDVVDIEDIGPDHSDAEPEGPTLVGFLRQLESAVDSFAGDMIVAEAREVLDDDAYREVLAACEAKFPTTDQGDQP